MEVVRELGTTSGGCVRRKEWRCHQVAITSPIWQESSGLWGSQCEGDGEEGEMRHTDEKQKLKHLHRCWFENRIYHQIILTKAHQGPAWNDEYVSELMPGEKLTWDLLLCQSFACWHKYYLECVVENLQVHSKFLTTQTRILVALFSQRVASQEYLHGVIEGYRHFLSLLPVCLHLTLGLFFW